MSTRPDRSGLADALKRIDIVLCRIEKTLAIVAALCVFVIMMVMVTDATLRYVFRFPLEWAHKAIESYLIVFTFFLALPYTVRVGEHVLVDFWVRHWAPRVRCFVAATTLFLSILLFSLIFWQSLIEAANAWRENRVDFGYIAWPTWLSLVFVPIGIGLLIVRLTHFLSVHTAAMWYGGALIEFAKRLPSDIDGPTDLEDIR